MAETGGKCSTAEEIWFNDAVALLAEHSGESADYAEQLLVGGLAAGAPWSHMKAGARVRGEAAFWRQTGLRRIDRAANSASYGPLIALAGPADAPSDVPASVKDIKVSRTAALALLPATEPETAPVGSETTSPAEPEATPPSSSLVSETAGSSGGNDTSDDEAERALSTAAAQPPLPPKEWVAHAIEECGAELVGLSNRKAAERMEEWAKDGKDGLRKPQKPIGQSRIRTIAVEQGLLPVKSAGN
jgi:hypothetical protein